MEGRGRGWQSAPQAFPIFVASADVCDACSNSQPGSPITYFPNPSTFAHTANSPSSSSLVSPHSLGTMRSSSRPGSTRNSSTEDEDHVGGDKTPTMKFMSLDSAGSSPRTSRGSTANSKAGGTGVSRTLSTPIAGYGATHHTSVAGLGLGNPESRKSTNDALASPRRISTSQTPSTSRQSPAGTLALPTHEAYYSISQPPSSNTQRFRDKPGEGRRHGHSHSAHFALPSSTLLAASSSMGAHNRQLSVASMANTPLLPPKSPAGSVMRRLKKSASHIGLHLGGQMEYDTDRAMAHEDGEDDEEGMRTNGTRVWYRCVRLQRYPLHKLTQRSSYVTIDWIHDAVSSSVNCETSTHVVSDQGILTSTSTPK